MRYHHIVEAKFIKRHNRFIAHCELEGEVVVCHIKNTCRCKELFIPGVTAYLEYEPSSSRKTDYSLISVKKGECLVNIDSQAPNLVAMEAIKEGIIFPEEVALIKREVSFKKSRFDLYVEMLKGDKTFIEVKSVTLEKDGIASFPGSPTKRGAKHIYELIEATKEGYRACILFIIQLSPIKCLTVLEEMDPEVAKALREAKAAGVEILAYDCQVTRDSLAISKPVPVRL